MTFPIEIMQVISNNSCATTQLCILISSNTLYNNIKISKIYDALTYDHLGHTYKPCPNIWYDFKKLINRCPYVTELNIIDINNIYDEDIRCLKNLRILYTNQNISDLGIKDMRLDVLHAKRSPLITNKGIKYMNLKELYLSSNTFITGNTIKYMNFHTLYLFNMLDSKYVKHMNLLSLDVWYNRAVNNDDIKYIRLNNLYAFRTNIDKQTMKHMDLIKLNIGENINVNDNDIAHLRLSHLITNSKISSNGIKDMNLEYLDATDNYNINDNYPAIKHVNIRILIVAVTDISDLDIKYMNIEYCEAIKTNISNKYYNIFEFYDT